MVAIVLAALVALVVAPPLLAAEIPRIAGPVTDETGVLDGRVDEVEAATDRLLEEHGVQLFVVFVPTTDELNAPEFASQTAESNSLGANDALLLVAVNDRTDAIWLADGLDAISDDEIDTILADVLEPRLRDGDFAGAAAATADALGTAVASAAPTEAPATAGPTTVPQPGAGGTGGDDGGLGLLPFVLVGLGAIVLVFGGARWLGATLTGRREAEERDRRTGKLAREANSLLVATDERIRTARQEIDYVEAAYGAAETEPLRAAVDTAQAELRAAFEVRQRLDDGEPEDLPTREAMLTEIVERSRRAQAALDKESERINELRDLERDAPTVLNELVARIERVEGRLPAAEAAMAELLSTAPGAGEPVRGNVVEARKGLAGARTAVDAGLAALGRDDRRTAATQARTAIVGVAGAAALLESIEKLLATVREATARVPQELDAAAAGIREAREALAAAPAVAADRGRIAAAEQAARDAEAAISRGDPLAALRAASEARRSADEAVATIRQATLERDRLLATAEASLATARADIDRAADFIATRRSGVGRAARTRLAEAERQLDAAFALRDGDPQRAIATARRSEQLAEQAYSLADRDFSGWDAGRPGPSLPGGAGSGADVFGSILGGILGGVLSGGGRGGGWGGSPWGSQGPFGGGGGWGGRRGGGPFGGGGGFGGGGFGGGGGGRARGGRW